jgi:predicted enzyme related to lactoylglutathione lyase
MTGPPTVLFAGVATADLEAAMPWYEAFFGRAADIEVNEDEVMWKVCDGGWLYLVLDPGRAGQALVAMAVPDLERAISELASRGLAAAAIETVGDAGRKAPVIDPEGNTINLIEVLGSQERLPGQ